MGSPRTDTNSDATQLAAIVIVVQGLLDKARQSRGDSSGESGEFKGDTGSMSSMEK